MTTDQGGENNQLQDIQGEEGGRELIWYTCPEIQGACPLIWADSAGWTGWEVLTVLDEWEMALVTVLVEVESENDCGVSICWYCSTLGIAPKRMDNPEVLC